MNIAIGLVMAGLFIGGIVCAFVEENRHEKLRQARRAKIEAIKLIEEAMDHCGTTPELKSLIRSTYTSGT